MDQDIECVIVGGPQHGTVFNHAWAASSTKPLGLSTRDGELCLAAARRQDSVHTRYLLLHPQATGAQFLTMLVA